MALCLARVLVDYSVDSADIATGIILAFGSAVVILFAGRLALGLIVCIEASVFAVPVEFNGFVNTLGLAEIVVDFCVVRTPVHEPIFEFRAFILTILNVFFSLASLSTIILAQRAA